jgi:hypothetical protein
MADTTNQDFLQSIIGNAIKQGWRVDKTTTHDLQGGIQTSTIQQNIYLYPPFGSCITQLHNGHKYPHIHIYYKEHTPSDINYVLSYVKCGDIVHGNGRYDRSKIKPVTFEFNQSETQSYLSQLLSLCKSCDIRAPISTPLIKSVIGKDTITNSSPVSKTTTFKPRAVQLGKSANAPLLVKKSIITAGKSTRRRRSKTRSIKQKKRKSRKNQSRRRKTTRK